MAEALGERLSLSLKVEVDPVALAVPDPLRQYVRELRAQCRRYSVRRLGAFGSVLREDFDPKRSDIDLAVEFGRSKRMSTLQNMGKLVQLRSVPVPLHRTDLTDGRHSRPSGMVVDRG